MPPSLQEIRKLLSQDRTEQAIERLLVITENTSWRDEVVQQAAQFRAWQRSKRQGTLSTQELDLARNRIHAALLEMVGQLSASDAEPELAGNPNNHNTPAKSYWRYIVGLGVIIGILAGLAEILGFFKGPDVDSSANTLTVLVHGNKGKDDLVLPGRGIVYLIYGDVKIPETINNEGEATFKQIPDRFFAEENQVELQFTDPAGESYRAANPDSLYSLERGEYVALEVVLEGMDQLEGTVKDFVTGELLDSVLIRMRGYSFYTNSFGEFTIEIPQNRQKQFIDLSFSKPGYDRRELSNIPTTTDQPQIINLKPMQHKD